jgi:hypothetical protein
LNKFETTLLELTEETERLADIFIAEGVIPLKYRDDALHIAVLVENDLDVIFSWNFKHIVKLKTKTMVNSIIIREGYKQVEIISPMEVVEDE